MSDASPAAPLDSSPVDKVSQDVRGIWLAVVCHILWGLLPLYFRLLHAVSPFEIVAQRVIWSLLLVLVLIALRTGLPSLLAVLRDRRVMWPLTASAILIAVNWLVYVWAVHADHVVAASLGYFLNPLVNVLLGVTFLHERLGRGQILALLIVATGVSILAVAAADTLWVSLAIALSFGLYGLVRKVTPVASMRGLGAETLVLAPFALAFVLWLASQGQLSFGTTPTITTLLVLAGGVTALPLLLFAAAARRLPLTMMGVIQYITPTLQFLAGIFVFHEKLNQGQLWSFMLIWTGLIIFTVDSVRAARSVRA